MGICGSHPAVDVSYSMGAFPFSQHFSPHSPPPPPTTHTTTLNLQANRRLSAYYMLCLILRFVPSVDCKTFKLNLLPEVEAIFRQTQGVVRGMCSTSIRPTRHPANVDDFPTPQPYRAIRTKKPSPAAGDGEGAWRGRSCMPHRVRAWPADGPRGTPREAG